MRKTWTLGATGAALAAVFATGGCYDFDKATEQCIQDGRCEPEGVGPDAGDAGDAGFDAGCTPADAADLPDDSFADTDCDGVDGQADAGFFIDPENGNDEQGAGTRESPLRTVTHALQLLREADGGGPVRLYLAGGAYNEPGLELDLPVSLHGGYIRDTTGWRRADNRAARLSGGTVGLTVRGLTDAGTRLEYVYVSSTDAVQPGAPSIALRMLGASGVALRHVTLEAGLGAAGADGGTGGVGQGGKDGSGGASATGTSTGAGGQAPLSACASDDRSGGAGGDGVFNRKDGNPGEPGRPDAGGGDGGLAGTFGVNCEGTLRCNCNGFVGGNGLPGTVGADGPSGTPGAGLGTLDVVGGTWMPNQQGGPGDAGLPGEGGGGGGSGGTCVNTSRTVAASGAGGGGGGGGCGGTGGQGGGGGGASIALLLVDSQVTVGAGTELRTRGGGAGGAGGPGGPGGGGGGGGGGGDGGVYDVQEVPVLYSTTGGNGGRGGRGGDGGTGGPGGGGGGGPSVGVWCGPRADVTLEAGGVTYTLADGGAGGFSTGNRGTPGERRETMDCTFP